MKKMMRKILIGSVALSAAATFLTAPVSAGWVKDTGGWWYQNSDQSFLKSGFQFVEGKWYCFDQNGYVKTGWVKEGGEWYLLDKNGVMQTGWVKENGKWYYLSENDFYGLPNGAMHTGYFFTSEDIYLFGADGAMVTGEYDDGLSKVVFGADGKLVETSYEDVAINYEVPKGWKNVGGGQFQTLLREDDVNTNIIMMVYEGVEEKLDATGIKRQSAAMKESLEQIGYQNVTVTGKKLTGDWDAAAQFEVKANIEIIGTSVSIRCKVIILQQDGLTGAVNLTATDANYSKYSRDFDKMVAGITLEKTNQTVSR